MTCLPFMYKVFDHKGKKMYHSLFFHLNHFTGYSKTCNPGEFKQVNLDIYL